MRQSHPKDLQTLFQKGCRYLDEKRWDKAERTFRELLKVNPHHAPSLMHLGNIASQHGDHDKAISLLQQAVEKDPSNPDVHANLGIALAVAGRMEDAKGAYQRALQLNPTLKDAHVNLGILFLKLNQLNEAIEQLDWVIERYPQDAKVWFLLGTAHTNLGHSAEGVACFRRCVALQSEHAEAWLGLAQNLFQLEEREAAKTCVEKALSYVREDNNLLLAAATTLYSYGEYERSLHVIQQRRKENATEALWLELEGIVLSKIGRDLEALEVSRRAYALDPTRYQALNTIGSMLYELGDPLAALVEYRKALERDPNNNLIWSNVFLMSHYNETDPEKNAAEHFQWGSALAQRCYPHRATLQNRPNPDRPLRIGYLSPDFRRHSVAQFIAPILLAHNRLAFEVFCYANVYKPDAFTERIRTLNVIWRDIVHFNDLTVANLIAQDQIDILVDLAGHTADNRLGVFAYKPAPIQMTYLGYPATTGLPTIDYRITDSYADPPGTTEHFYTEKLLRLDPCFLCYNPIKDAPPVVPPPSLSGKPIVFGSFNKVAKICETCIHLWAEVLKHVPDSMLYLKGGPFDRVIKRFEEEGIPSNRIITEGFRLDMAHHMAAYGQVDIALDTYPYNGTTTTCEALWMGVPVVTLAGRVHASRVGCSLLHAAGLPELVAQTPEEFVKIAVELAKDPERLRTIREGMRDRLWKSPLIDMKSFTRRLEAAYRQVWREWCAHPTLLHQG